MKPATIRVLHRWTGLICALAVLAASSSGILHVAMTWTQSPPPRPRPADAIAVSLVEISPAEAATRIGATDADIRSLALRTIGGQPWYQIITAQASGPLYVNAVNGKTDLDADARYATEIAARQAGNAPVKWTRRLDGFDGEYITIFRLLPVHRIEVADGKGTRLYVSTLTGSVARATDDGRQLEADIFSNVHKYAFISNHVLRDGFLVTLMTTAFLASVAGIVLFFATRRRNAHRTSSQTQSYS